MAGQFNFGQSSIGSVAQTATIQNLDVGRRRSSGRGGHGESSGAPKPTQLPKLGIICVKDHEQKMMVKLLTEQNDSFTTPVPDKPKSGSGYQIFRCQTKNTKQMEVVIAHFKGRQGSMFGALLTTRFLFLEQPRFIVMVGIAGGTRLGEVIIATRAIYPEDGRVVQSDNISFVEVPVTTKIKLSGVNKYRRQNKDKDNENGYFVAGPGKNGVLEKSGALERFIESCDKDTGKLFGKQISVKHRMMLCYPQVRQDCVHELHRMADTWDVCKADSVIDMESYAFFESVEEHQEVTVLAVIKGTSDVGVEVLADPEAKTSSELVDHNEKQLLTVKCDETDATKKHEAMRKAYRSTASENAARVTLALLKASLFDDDFSSFFKV